MRGEQRNWATLGTAPILLTLDSTVNRFLRSERFYRDGLDQIARVS